MLWIKAWHLIFMVTWFAGLFYLPRLYVYHAMSDDYASIERFKVMERKLFYGIMTPALLATFSFGFWLLSYNWDFYWSQTWFLIKFGLLLSLVVYHYICWRQLLVFKQDRNSHSHVYYRWFNEVPVFGLVFIIILAVVRPFS